jgi:sulfoxide reductase heme-binding subunit YedZ
VSDEPAIESFPEVAPFESGSQRRRRRRIRHNVVIMVAGLVVGLAIGVLFPSKELRAHISVATAYVSLGLVALSLMLGPLNLIRNSPNPLSNDLRRDLGIWGAIVGLVHVGIGLTVHFQGRMYLYFLPPPEWGAIIPIRTDAFGGANYLGAVAGLVLLVLLTLSNDKALHRLGAIKWKRWQQLNYVAGVTILLHGVLYQLLEKRRIGFVVLFALVSLATLGLQLLGIRRSRRPRAAGRRSVAKADARSSLR